MRENSEKQPPNENFLGWAAALGLGAGIALELARQGGVDDQLLKWVDERSNGKMARAREQATWFMRCWQPRLWFFDLLAGMIPEYFAYQQRAQLYRLGGCKLAEGVKVYGRLRLYGTKPDKAGNLEMGPNSNIAPFCILGVDGPIKIGENVGVGPGVHMWTTYHAEGPSGSRYTDDVRTGGIIIEAGAVIHSDVTIAPGVRVGHGAIVMPKAMVTKDVAPNTKVGGVPAKVIKYLPEGPPDKSK